MSDPNNPERKVYRGKAIKAVTNAPFFHIHDDEPDEQMASSQPSEDAESAMSDISQEDSDDEEENSDELDEENAEEEEEEEEEESEEEDENDEEDNDEEDDKDGEDEKDADKNGSKDENEGDKKDHEKEADDGEDGEKSEYSSDYDALIKKTDSANQDADDESISSSAGHSFRYQKKAKATVKPQNRPALWLKLLAKIPKHKRVIPTPEDKIPFKSTFLFYLGTPKRLKVCFEKRKKMYIVACSPFGRRSALRAYVEDFDSEMNLLLSDTVHYWTRRGSKVCSRYKRALYRGNLSLAREKGITETYAGNGVWKCENHLDRIFIGGNQVILRVCKR